MILRPVPLAIYASLALTPGLYAQLQATELSFSVPEQPLAHALLDYARQASVSIAAPEALTAGRRGRAVYGKLTRERALQQMLEGSGLAFSFPTPNTIRVFDPTEDGGGP